MKLCKGKKALGCKWGFKIKLKANNMLNEYKAQLVVKGYNQIQGNHYKTYLFWW